MKPTLGEKIFNIFNIILMLLLCAIMVYPYINQLAISFNQGVDTSFGGITFFPRKFTLDNYQAVFSNKSVISAFFISLLRVLLGTAYALIITTGAAYGLTRRNLPGKKWLSWFFVIPAYIHAGVIPVYMLYRYLGLMNNFLVYVLPAAFVFYNMVIIRSFLQQLPASIEESAYIDGANDLQILFKIIIPLSLPVLATISLWVAVGHWNDWTTTLMYVTERTLYPLQYLMMKIIKESETAQQMALDMAVNGEATAMGPTPDSVKAATLIVITFPIIMCYPFLQKYFIQGVVVGAVKE